ncbi:HD-GYP domain-containing protein [Metabacillus fastidiosus]|uniref:HD-GYP domain-containing protein n=1 Tax=Metabacillus fastidiosus TaxID=1458 RepID=A0ABU6P1N9_9BACI|nr:HD-GYP domain-containing protein [Metabacillus fastidiosus]
MKVDVSQLNEGSILMEDVVLSTKRPLAHKKTIINLQHIEAFKAFLIDSVEVEPTVMDVDIVSSKDAIEEKENSNSKINENIQQEINDFYSLYVKAVNSYKQLYIAWQSGMTIEISKIRDLVLPLVKALLNNKEEILKISHYTKTEEYYFYHPISVSLLSAYLADSLNMSEGEINQISITGLLADCGMSKIDQSILKKNNPLTEQDFREMKQHPAHSYNMIKNIPSLKEAVKIGVLQHHERIDGSGYPMSLSGSKLHLYGKIVAIADTFQAMVCDRPYRRKQSPFKVLEQMIEDDFGKFDIMVLDELKKIIAKLSVGTKVRLSNNQIGEIVFTEEQYPTRPMLRIINTNEFIALKEKRDLYIEELV